ncbi:MAG: DNA primase [Roseivirga sp.]|nr:DNA primase [Roseivirga sp.]
MAISNETINEIKTRADILEVVGDFVDLKKAGSSYRGLSPFTNEKTPSFYVSPSKEIYKCFSSGKGGDAISFIMELEGINYIEALKFLANKYGIEVEEEEQTDEQIQAQNERESLFIILNFAKDYFAETLLEHDEGKSIGLSYFKERGFSEETIRKFDLGYSLDTWDGFMKAAEKKGFKREIMEKAGLILASENKTYDRFRGRVMFPIHNVAGKAIAFGARILTNNKKQPKYINSPETEVYHKSNIVYGIHQAKQEIRNADMCYLVEGYTDVISMHQSGVHNVVSSSGTSLTKEQIQLIGRYTKNITVLYDGDNAGIKASFRGIDLILEHDLDVKAVVFPEGEDPDSFSRTMSSEAFVDYLKENAKDFITFKTNVLTDGGKKVDPASKVQVIRDVIASIALIPDGIKRSVYIQSCAHQLDIEEQVLLSELNKLLITKQQKENQQRFRENEPPEAANYPPEAVQEEVKETHYTSYYVERQTLRMLVNYGGEPFDEETSIAEFILDETEEIKFKDEMVRKVIEQSSALLARGEKINPDEFIGPHDPVMSQLVIDLLELNYFISSGWQERHRIGTPHEKDDLAEAVFKVVLRLKRKKLEELTSETEEALKNSTNPQEQDELIKIYIHYKRLFDEVGKQLGIVVAK